MLLKFPYGEDFVKTEIPEENLELAVSCPSIPVTDLEETVKKVLRKPVQSKALRRFLGRNKTPWSMDDPQSALLVKRAGNRALQPARESRLADLVNQMADFRNVSRALKLIEKPFG